MINPNSSYQHINAILQPDITCHFKTMRSYKSSKIEIEYNSLSAFSYMLKGNFEDAMLDIGDKLYLNNIEKQFIQIFNTEKRLICNQELKIVRKGGAIHLNKPHSDFIIHVMAGNTSKREVTFVIYRAMNHSLMLTDTIMTNTNNPSIFELSKKTLGLLFFGLMKSHGLLEQNARKTDVLINMHNADFKTNQWTIISDLFSITN